MLIYDIFFLLFSIIYLPYLLIKGKAHKDFKERFGILPPALQNIANSRPIWIHAVSVGEVLAAKDFVRKLSSRFPERKVVLSTTTRTGNSVARNVLGKDILKFYFPLDFSFVIKRVINIINPSLVAIMETEIWPNLVLELSRRKIPVLLVNGRLSERSFRGYKKVKFLFEHILKRFKRFCMQTEEDAERIKALGAPREVVKITGNMKFDVDETKNRNPIRTKKDLGLDETHELIIAGSTHAGEEEIILDAYKALSNKFENLRLLIAPRHIDRALSIKKIINKKGFETFFLSKSYEKPPEKAVLVLDTLGELSQLFSLASVVFMGGSLVKRGGHNLVEPAVFSKPVVFGRYMHNFRDMARMFLEGEAAIRVKNERELSAALEELLQNKEKRIQLGERAKGLIEKLKGATERNVRELAQLLLD